MKLRVFLFLFAIVGIAGLAAQRRAISALRIEESLVTAEQERWESTVRGLRVEAGFCPPKDGLSEAGLLVLKQKVEDFREMLKTSQSESAVQLWDTIYEPLAKLSEQQLAAMIDGWTGGHAVTDEFIKQSNWFITFMFEVADVNPSTTLKVLAKHPWQTKEENRISHYALWSWFRSDSASLLRWLGETCQRTDFDGQAGLWADGAAIVREPSVDNVKNLLSQPADQQRWVYGELLLQIPTVEGRIAFLHSLQVATGGISDDLLALIKPLMVRTPFLKMAQLADATPTIRASGKIVESDDRPWQAPIGSLRFELARGTRDATVAERWEWLIQREEDRPTGKALQKLVMSWCENDYFDTATWAKTLPDGETRDSVANGIVEFLHQYGMRAMMHSQASQMQDTLMNEWRR